MQIKAQLSHLLLLFFSLLIGCKAEKNFLAAPEPALMAKSSAEAYVEPDLSEFLQLFDDRNENEEIERNFVEGCTQMMRGDLDEALVYFQKVLDADPDNHPTLYNAARIYHEQKQYEKAVELAQKAVKGDPNNYWYHKFFVKALSSVGSISNAIAAQKDLVKKFPEKSEDKMELAELYLKSQQAEESLKVLSQIEKDRGLNRMIGLRKYEINRSISDDEAALENISALLNNGFTDVGIYQRQFEVLMKLGRGEEASMALDGILEQDPENGMALMNLAEFYRRNNQTEKSDNYLFRAFASTDIKAADKLGIIKQLLPYTDGNAEVRMRVDKLIQVFKASHPGNPETALLESRLNGGSSPSSGNLAAFREALDKNPEQIDLWLELLAGSFQQKDYKQLNKDAELALEYYPNQSQFLYYYGKSASIIEDFGAATYAFKKLKKIAASDALLSAASGLELGYIYKKQNKKEDADQSLSEAKAALDQANDQMKNTALYFELQGDYFAIQNNPEEAEKSWEEARKKGAGFSIEAKLKAFGYNRE